MSVPTLDQIKDLLGPTYRFCQSQATTARARGWNDRPWLDVLINLDALPERLLALMTGTDSLPPCSQCGQPFSERACGFAHAIIAGDPTRHRLYDDINAGMTEQEVSEVIVTGRLPATPPDSGVARWRQWLRDRPEPWTAR